MEENIPLEASWMVALVAGALALILLLEMARSLPGPHILLIVLVLLAGEGGLQYYFERYTRMELTVPLWWYLTGGALLWMTVVLGSRRLAQLILRPWRRERFYGFWLLGVSALVTAMFQFGWPRLNMDYIDTETIEPGQALAMTGMRAGATVVLLACLFPWFIQKRPVPEKPPSKPAQEPENKAQ